MKQHITERQAIEFFVELTTEQKAPVLEFINGRKDIMYYHWVKESRRLPLLNIGQMIEFLVATTHKENFGEELCDALWKAVKQKLSTVAHCKPDG